MARATIRNAITIDYLDKPIDEVTTEEVQKRESWYNTKVQRHYTSTIRIKVPIETRGTPIEIPGAERRYACKISKEGNRIVLALQLEDYSDRRKRIICTWNIISRDPSGQYIPTPTGSQSQRWDFSESSSLVCIDPPWFPTLKTILGNKSIQEHGYFYLTMQIWNTEDCGSQLNNPPHPFGVMLEMANQFNCHLQMNDRVEFECPSNREGKLKKLYAWVPILSLRSEYFKTMFESSFAEGNSSESRSTTNGKTPRNSPPKKAKLNLSTDRTRHVVIEDDYDVLHNVLYYIYTNRITFSTDLTVDPVNSTTPRLCATEDIYEMANRMFLDDLKLKALNFLKSNCTFENITERLFSQFSYLYNDVGEIYGKYFVENFKDIKTTRQYRRFFKELERDGDLREIVRVFNQYRKAMAQESFDL